MKDLIFLIIIGIIIYFILKQKEQKPFLPSPSLEGLNIDKEEELWYNL